jgi:succinate dehydrogenase/fumarate reductase flavoprotein subunit
MMADQSTAAGPDAMEWECDMVVLGAGMAGLSCAARAAEAGAKVVVLEKATKHGGSALLSGGYLWTATKRVLRAYDDGDPELQDVLVGTFADAVAWLRARNVEMSAPQPVLHGRGYRIDIVGHLQDCINTIEARGGHVLLNQHVVAPLLASDGTVEGVQVRDGTYGDVYAVRAGVTTLATGGFQGNPDLRARLIHPQARNIPLRSNPTSTGDGLTIGLAAGAAYAGDNSGFYGHLVSSPSRLDKPGQFAMFSQYQSDYSLLFNEAGLRFTDESLGDFRNSAMTVSQTNARALLVWDDFVQAEHVLKAHVLGGVVHDRLKFALDHDAFGAMVARIPDLATVVSAWGFDGQQVVHSIERYNHAVRNCPERLDPPTSYFMRPMDRAPFYALVVEPAITFTHGGLRVDAQARALAANGEVVPGLLVAGADIGNVYRNGYAGGLALALTFGLRAAETALASSSEFATIGR